MQLITGNKALSEALGVSRRTIQSWRKEGILAQATVSDIRRIIIYDLDKVLQCLQNSRLYSNSKTLNIK